MIETLTEEGLPVAEALRSVGMQQTDYDRWRSEYSGLGRTLGPLLSDAVVAEAREEAASYACLPPAPQAGPVTRL